MLDQDKEREASVGSPRPHAGPHAVCATETEWSAWAEALSHSDDGEQRVPDVPDLSLPTWKAQQRHVAMRLRTGRAGMCECPRRGGGVARWVRSRFVSCTMFEISFRFSGRLYR